MPTPTFSPDPGGYAPLKFPTRRLFLGIAGIGAAGITAIMCEGNKLRKGDRVVEENFGDVGAPIFKVRPQPVATIYPCVGPFLDKLTNSPDRAIGIYTKQVRSLIAEMHKQKALIESARLNSSTPQDRATLASAVSALSLLANMEIDVQCSAPHELLVKRHTAKRLRYEDGADLTTLPENKPTSREFLSRKHGTPLALAENLFEKLYGARFPAAVRRHEVDRILLPGYELAGGVAEAEYSRIQVVRNRNYAYEVGCWLHEFGHFTNVGWMRTDRNARNRSEETIAGMNEAGAFLSELAGTSLLNDPVLQALCSDMVTARFDSAISHHSGLKQSRHSLGAAIADAFLNASGGDAVKALSAFLASPELSKPLQRYMNDSMMRCVRLMHSEWFGQFVQCRVWRRSQSIRLGLEKDFR